MSDLRDIAVKYAHLLSAPDYSKLLNLANEIEELRSYLSEEREKNEKQVRMTMDAHAEIELLKAVREAHVDEIYEKNAKLGVSYDDKFTGMELGKLRATVEEQQAEIELLQAVVDAAKELTLVEGWQMESYWNALDKALAALEDDDE